MKNFFRDDILQELGRTLIKRKETLSVSESVTSGAIQFALSTVIEASRFYQGGITAYNLAQKFRHLDVEPIHAQEVNCVSSKVAEQMALHVSTKFTSDWGLGITGYAVPVPESDNRVFAYYAITRKGEVCRSGKIDPAPGEAVDLQVYYANHVLETLGEVISTLPASSYTSM